MKKATAHESHISLIKRRIPTVPNDKLVSVNEHKWTSIEITSWSELLRHEEEILHRIASVKNGGHLFLVHPLQLLKDIGVSLNTETRIEILKHEPNLGTASLSPYNALRHSSENQNIQVHVHGLFRRPE
jgi:hypothetical protein